MFNHVRKQDVLNLKKYRTTVQTNTFWKRYKTMLNMLFYL